MTLLEALLATVLLSVVAVACLEGTRGAAQLQGRAEQAELGVAHAEAVLAQAAAGLPVDPRAATVRRTRYVVRGRLSDLDRLEVTVPLTNGRVMALTRLVRRAPERPQ